MAYPPRVDLPGLFHVTSRAVNFELLFRDAEDYERFLWIFGRETARRRWTCLAYCLIGTHLHVVLETHEPGISDGMRDVLATYARRHNMRHGRRGHLVERRFKAKHIADEQHLYRTLRYVELNPVEAGICARPEEWPWSSFAAIAGLRPRQAFLDLDRTLRLFDAVPERARPAYRALVEQRL